MSIRALVVLLLIGTATLPFSLGVSSDSTLARTTPRARASTFGPLVNVPVRVPAALNSAPFDVPRTLNVPRGYTISVYARVPDARFMILTPEGDLLVSEPGNGTIVRLHATGSKAVPTVTTLLSGLNEPQGMAFQTIKGTTYLYVGEETQIDRFTWNARTHSVGAQQVIIGNLPSGPTADGDTHPLKDLVFGPDHKLYVSMGSSCNACTGDTTSTPRRAAIYQYNADGSGGRLYASGLRNAEGLAFVPGTTTLWVTVNERDNTAYPFKDNTGQYGQVVPSYVDNHPPDEFTSLRAGGNYGWPYCNPDPDTSKGYNVMPFDPDAQYNQTSTYNPNGGIVDCRTMDRIRKGIQAHSAPLGLTFLQGTAAPAAVRQTAVIALHGSWNRTTRTGYKVIYFPWLAAQGTVGGTPGAQADLVTGWLDSTAQNNWDRPVDVIVDRQGNLLISADGTGSIYKMSTSVR